MAPSPQKQQSSAYRALAGAAAPVLALPFPGRWRIFAALINDPRWATFWDGAPLRWTRCKNTGLSIPCDMGVFSGRIAWYFRRWYEIDTQSAIISLLPQGGTFVDIGANCGMASLSAAAAIGTGGRIVAFEPNPAVAAIYTRAMERNGLGPVVSFHNAAIAERDGQMDLFVPASNHGEASLATQFDGRAGQIVSVRVSSGGELAGLDRIDLVKIDVEGFEATVLSAIAPILQRFKPPVITELMDEHLERAGTDSEEVVQLMNGLGYRGFAMTTQDVGLFRQRAALAPLAAQTRPRSCNALWLHASSPMHAEDIEFLALKK